MIFGLRTFFTIKLAFWIKYDFNLFYYDAILKDQISFKQTHVYLNDTDVTETDVIVVKKHFIKKVRLTLKKEC